MLELNCLSVAMANSTDKVKEKADLVTTKTNDEAGLWDFINELF